MKNVKMKIKVNIWELPNGMHFDIQRTTRASVYKSKKGKGSYTRNSKYQISY